MRWFGAAGRGFYRISHYIRGKRYEFIPLFFALPCFKISHTFFKSAYFLQQRRLSRKGRECALLGGKDLSLQFSQRIPKFDEIADLYQFLDALARRTQGRGDGV